MIDRHRFRRPVGFDLDYVAAGRARFVRRVVCMLAFEGRAATSRWQFLNPLAAANLRFLERFVRRFDRLGRVDRPVFFVGMGRSGTTLVMRMMSVLPSVVTLNEPTPLHLAVNDDADVTGQYRPTGRFRLDATDVTAHASATVRARIAGVCAVTGARRYLERNPDHLFRLDWLVAMMPDSVFVAVVRRPDAVARSVVKFNDLYGDERRDWWGRDDARWNAILAELRRRGDPLEPLASGLDAVAAGERALVEWVLCGRTILESSFPLTVVSFERLVCSPGPELDRLLRACEIDDDGRARASTLRTVHRPDGFSTDELLLDDMTPELTSAVREVWKGLSELSAV